MKGGDDMDGGRLTVLQIEETLKKCRKQIFVIESLQKMQVEISKQMEYVKGMNYERPHVSSSDISDLGAKVEAADERLRELDEKVAAAIETHATLRLDALDLIEQCETSVQMAVLTNYYVLGYSWEEVAKKISYAEISVYKIRYAALKAIERRTNKNEKII